LDACKLYLVVWEFFFSFDFWTYCESSMQIESLDQDVDLWVKTRPIPFVPLSHCHSKTDILSRDCPNFDPLTTFTFPKPKTNKNQDEHHVPTTLQRPSYPGHAPTGGLQEGKCYYSSITGAGTNDYMCGLMEINYRSTLAE